MVYTTIQKDLNKLERSLVNFNKGKCQILCLGKNNSMHQYVQKAKCLERSFAKKDLGVLVHNKLTMSQQHTLIAKDATYLVGCVGVLPSA